MTSRRSGRRTPKIIEVAVALILDTSILIAAEREEVSFPELLGDDLRTESSAILSTVPVIAFDLVVARV